MAMEMLLSSAERYLPTDTEVLICLKRKLRGLHNHPDIIIHEKDVYTADPWRLIPEAYYHHDTGDGAFFYTERHCTGTGTSSRATRDAGSGYWHGNSHTNSIFVYTDDTKTEKVKIGCKTSLAFKKNPALAGEDWPPDTGEWIMHEFRLDGNNDYAICRIHRIRKSSNKKRQQQQIRDVDQQPAADEAVIMPPALKRSRPPLAPMTLMPSPSSILQETCRSTEGGLVGHRQEMINTAQTAPYYHHQAALQQRLYHQEMFMHSRLYLNQPPPAMVDQSRACMLPALPADYWELPVRTDEYSSEPHGSLEGMVCNPVAEPAAPDQYANFMVVSQRPTSSTCYQPPVTIPSQTPDEDLWELGNLPAPLPREEDCLCRLLDARPEQPAGAFDSDTMLGKESCRLEGGLGEYSDANGTPRPAMTCEASNVLSNYWEPQPPPPVVCETQQEFAVAPIEDVNPLVMTSSQQMPEANILEDHDFSWGIDNSIVAYDDYSMFLDTPLPYTTTGAGFFC